MKEQLSNREFLKENDGFLNLCKKANVKPTMRQASKFRRGVGAVFQITIAHKKDTNVPAFAKIDPNI